MNENAHNPMDYIEIDKDKPWLTGRTPNGYWKVERHRLMAIKWLFEERLQWTDEDIKKHFVTKTIHQNKLTGLLKYFTRVENISSSYHFVDLYTNGRVKPWELIRAPQGMYHDPTFQKDAIHWLFEEKLKWSDNDFKQKLSKEIFVENGFSNFLYYYDSYFHIMEFAYPGRFKPWEVMGYVHDGYWSDKENRRDAIYWLLKQLDMPLDEFISSPLSSLAWREKFQSYNLGGLYDEYRNSCSNLKKDLFPEYFTEGANDQ